jgi:hypothetical protein
MKAEAESASVQVGLDLAPDGDLRVLQEIARALRRTRRLVAKMPPQPPTLRTRIGASLVRLVRRTLFWYTSQLVQFRAAVTRAVEGQLRALEILWCPLPQRGEENKRLRERVETLDETWRRLASLTGRCISSLTFTLTSGKIPRPIGSRWSAIMAWQAAELSRDTWKGLLIPTYSLNCAR